MNALVVYDSQYGNTERIARIIAGQLGTPRLVAAAHVDIVDPFDCDVLVIGGPTQLHRVSPALESLIDAMPGESLKGLPVVAFDTRYRMPRMLSGSAAAWIANHLRQRGAHILVSPESFFIERDTPPKGDKRRHEMEHLELGEEERAAEWACDVYERVNAMPARATS